MTNKFGNTKRNSTMFSISQKTKKLSCVVSLTFMGHNPIACILVKIKYLKLGMAKIAQPASIRP